eukprot:122574-Prymnesium_polylepis.1
MSQKAVNSLLKRPSLQQETAGLVVDPEEQAREERRKAATTNLERIINTAPLNIDLAVLQAAIVEAEASGVLKSIVTRAQSKAKYADKVKATAERKQAEEQLV